MGLFCFEKCRTRAWNVVEQRIGFPVVAKYIVLDLILIFMIELTLLIMLMQSCPQSKF